MHANCKSKIAQGKFMNMLAAPFRIIIEFLREHFKKLTADTLGWLAAIILHCATVPSMLAMMAGLSDRPPNIDLVLFVWTGLVLLFARAIVLKDNLNIVTIGTGFVVQAMLLGFIVFR